MEVRMEITEGLGKLAEVWVDGHSLFVCDNVSTPQKLCRPGVVRNAAFRYVSREAFGWDQAVAENAGRKRILQHQHHWSYVGYGRVVQIMPVRIDFGLLCMEDANWTTVESLVDEFVRVAIDRLEIAFAGACDWPAECV